MWLAPPFRKPLVCLSCDGHAKTDPPRTPAESLACVRGESCAANRGRRLWPDGIGCRRGLRARIRFAIDLEEFVDRELLIEAVHENEAAKIAVFEQLDELVQDANAILTSNTSSIPIKEEILTWPVR